MYQDDDYSYQNGTDEFYASMQGGQQKKKRSIGRTLSKGLLSIVMVVAICLLSITGYIWFTEPKEERTAPAWGTPAISGQSQETGQSIKTNYVLGETKEALTTPEIYIKVLPSVVSITCEIEAELPSFGFYGNQAPQAQTSTATGTGIIMTADGYIMTNHHVIDGAKSITIATYDGVEYQATLIGSDEKSDIAILKVEATGLSAAEFGDSTQLIVGEAAIVIGNPLGTAFAGTLTQGVISSTERHLSNVDESGNTYMMSYIQTDAAVNPGNSGGPLINSRGQVVGVVNQKISRSDVEGIGFAIPTSVAMDIAYDLIENGQVTIRPVLGVTVSTYTAQTAEYYNELYKDDIAAGIRQKAVAGMIVQEVVAGSTCDVAGVLPGDEIIAFNGVSASSVAELNLAKEKGKIGDAATLTIKRGGQTLVLDLILQGSNS